MNKRQAAMEAKRRSALGYPHRAVEIIAHDQHCLISDGLIIRPHRCTCGDAKRTGRYVLVVGK